MKPARLQRVGRAWVADTSTVTGEVTLGEDANLWFGVVVRGDDAPIRIGARTNVQDNTVVHTDPDAEHVIGRDVTIGHGAICHGIRIHDRALIGMGATLLEGSVIGEGAIVGAGAVVTEGMEVPPYTLVVGVPAKAVKTLDKAERDAHALWMVEGYVRRCYEYERGVYDGRVDA